MRLAVATVSVLALGAAACGELPDPSNIVDLRVLAVKCEPAGFLVNLDDPGMATDAELEATLTALVVDPTGGGQAIEVSAVGCPDYIDTITSATLQGSKLCPPASAVSQLPPDIASVLATRDATAMTPAAPVADGSNEYNPTVKFGLTSEQIAAFFTLGRTPIPEVEQSIKYNQDFGLPAIVNLSFSLNGQNAVAIKRVVYWPRLRDEDKPDPTVVQVPNQNPYLGEPGNPAVPEIRFYRHRDELTGTPDQPLPDDVEPMISIAAGDKLYVEPNYLPAATESYLLRVNNPDRPVGDQVETKVVDRELLRFYFYATAGRLEPLMQFSELNPVLTSGTLHTDAEWLPLLKPDAVPPNGRVTIWIVVQDERAGTAWAKRTVNVVP